MENVLLPSEIEMYIDAMKPSQLANIGSKLWLGWHQRLLKLNQQAVLEASAVKEEQVKEALVSYEKIPLLVHEAILINVWKYKILPHILKLNPQCDQTFVAYSILYHEAVCVALLELVLFHPGASENLGDSAADLLEYAYDSAAQLLVLEQKDTQVNEVGIAEVLRQQENLAFDIGIRSLSILRYLIEHLDRLTLSVADRIYNVHDVPILIIEILLCKPWINNNKLYQGGKWIPWDGEVLGQCEAQVWLALCQMLLTPICATYYSITDTRRSQLMKLFPLMQPVLLDQLSPLLDLKYWLHRLSVSDQPCAPPKPILLETILQVKANILNQGEHKWKKIAKQQFSLIFGRNREELLEIAQGLSEAYNTDLLEKFETKPTTNSCAKCGKGAVQRCSKCKSIWYCSRSCQVDDWVKHKDHCIAKEN